MNKLLFTVVVLIYGTSVAQIHTPTGGINSATTNPQTGNVGIGTDNPQTKLDINGDISFGEAGSNTLFRDNAGSFGSNIRSGFYQTTNPVNYPNGASGWWHLLDVRHSNPTNNYALQIAGSFFDQNLWFRKTSDNPSQSWRKILAEQSNGNVGIGTDNPQAKLEVNGGINIASSFPIQLNGNDSSHGLKYKKYFNDGTTLLDGPFLYGWDGGSLGYKRGETEVHVLNWKFDKVGIGTDNPQGKLDIFGNSPSTTNLILSANYKDAFRWRLNTIDRGNAIDLDFTASEGNDQEEQVLRLSRSNSTRPEFQLYDNALVANDGKIGIGTDTPQGKLDIFGNSPSTTNLILSANYSDAYRWRFNTIDRGYAIDLDFTASGGNDEEEQVLKLSRSDSTRPEFQLYNNALVANDGKIGIGTDTPQTKLDVVGTSSFSDNMKVTAKLEAKEIKVTTTPTADFVFAEEYKLPKLEEVEKHIKEKKHLPEIASAKEMEKEGVNIGEFQIKLLQKIEELTLYSIEQNKKSKEQEQQLKTQTQKIEKLERMLLELTNKKQ